MKKSIPKTLLIIGLGNPGEQYNSTPHNAGFLTVNQLLKEWALEVDVNSKLKSEIAEYKIGSRKIILAKPQTFMNKSGEAALALTKTYKLKAENALWVIHDDVDLGLGKIKIVKNRGSAGHKGVEDIMRKLKTRDFVRFRIGIRPRRLATSRSQSLMNKFVASPINKNDWPIFKKSIARCKDAILFAIEEGFEKAANIYNAN